MSILNFLLEDERFVLSFDTLTFNVDAWRYGSEGSKCLYVPHNGVLIAARGDPRNVMIAQELVAFSAAQCFDEIEEVVDAILARVTATLQRAGVEVDGDFGRVDLLLAGWSAKRAAMACLRYRREHAFAWQAVRPMRAAVAPDGFPGEQKIRPDCLRTPDGHMRIARRQVAHWRRVNQESETVAPIGGRLIVVEMRRETVSFVDCGVIVAPLKADELRALDISPELWSRLVERPAPDAPDRPIIDEGAQHSEG